MGCRAAARHIALLLFAAIRETLYDVGRTCCRITSSSAAPHPAPPAKLIVVVVVVATSDVSAAVCHTALGGDPGPPSGPVEDAVGSGLDFDGGTSVDDKPSTLMPFQETSIT